MLFSAVYQAKHLVKTHVCVYSKGEEENIGPHFNTSQKHPITLIIGYLNQWIMD